MLSTRLLPHPSLASGSALMLTPRHSTALLSGPLERRSHNLTVGQFLKTGDETKERDGNQQHVGQVSFLYDVVQPPPTQRAEQTRSSTISEDGRKLTEMTYRVHQVEDRHPGNEALFKLLLSVQSAGEPRGSRSR